MLIVPAAVRTKDLTRERALEILKPHPQGWGARHSRLHPDSKGNRFLFERVPTERRHIAHQKFDELVARWFHDHPGGRMTQGKRASLIANASNYAMHVVNWHWIYACKRRWREVWQAKRFLAKLELDQFQAQPLQRRVKRLPL